MTVANIAIMLRPMTPTQRLAELYLTQPVAEYIATKRQDGKSWQAIASRLRHDTGGAVDVSRETLRQWANTEAAA